ncbi:mediator of RNA polymerase II transcription subunit 15 isoform X2 [Schistocerca americana]|uniref:mediator of RNA polymerase II transcription subunit 15 n=1 Tax=Schistocerca serialis cubense TaxID=2023355 RepID=UPI001F4FA939|nr:mediator of RNA polymerase II transcription subunit 15 isoform X2 [Schistocerca americana]XP_049960057.1 mediator of RNA polymerase II transcription subunit 15 [Schistocerca serialis cubense]
MAGEEGSWRTAAFRQSVVSKIDEAIQRSGMPTAKNSVEMENHVFQKAKTKEEYLSFVARLILHVRELNAKKGQGMNGPAGGAGQTMQDPINALQTLARQGTGNAQMIGLGPQAAGMVPQPPNQIPASNLLQTLNQRPGQPLGGLTSLQNKVPDLGLGPGAQVGAIGQMAGQMQAQMQGAQMGPQLTAQIQQQQLSGQMRVQMAPGPLQSQMQAQMQVQMQTQMGTQMAGQLPSQLHAQIPHIAQIQGSDNMMMANQASGFAGSRQFLRQSPSPSAPSPAGLTAGPASNQMAASPALVPSPSSQLTPMSVPQRSVGMAPSPSSSLNTPGPAVPTPSPCSQQEDQAYIEKVRQLSKYIEPLRRMIAKMGNDDVEKLSKMKKLLEILSNPNKRMPLETLLKCEVVLEKLDFKRGEGILPPPTHISALKEHSLFNPLLEAVSNTLQSSFANHTLQRTFGPCLEALYGPEIKMMPPPLKKKKVEEQPNDIPDVLQGEIARLDQRFKVSLDPTQQPGSRAVQLLCWLDDKHLPCVPPVSLSVPEDYPQTPPRCHMAPHEYGSTGFLAAVREALASRILKLPGRFSVSQLLDTWEMSVRQASAPATVASQTQSTSAATLLLGL